MKFIERTTRVELDDAVQEAAQAFDFEFNGTYTSKVQYMPSVPNDFSLGVIFGSSGSGKTTLLDAFGKPREPSWDGGKAIVSHFVNSQDAINKLGASGLNDIPSWVKPYHALSNGQQFRADLARQLTSNATIDEFSSVVNRSVAKSASVAIRKYIDKHGLKGLVLATCHDDVLDWLQPDWTYNSDTCELRVGRYLRRPAIRLELHRSAVSEWARFKRHHYLSGDINAAANCYAGVLDGDVVAFSAVLPLPSGTIKNAWRGHRTVVLPDYQGMGLGVRFSDAVAQLQIDDGRRYYSKTTHPRMGTYRENSPLWRATCKNGKKRTEEGMNTYQGLNSTYRLGVTAYSHEYIGPTITINQQNKGEVR